MRDLAWKHLESNYIFKDTWANVRADKCMRPDGKIIEPYYVYDFPRLGYRFCYNKRG